MLNSALSSGGPASLLSTGPGITAKSPDLITTGPDEAPQLNLFMYYASLNPSLRNEGLPSASASGGRLSNPPLALNLHYLISAYGATQYDPEILLAWAMQVFHDTPVLPRQSIQDALTGLLTNTTTEAQLIGHSTLANQVELIRITPEALTTEEIYRLWTAFKTSYRPTTSYRISVVIIQGTQSFTSNLPVQRRTVSALPLTPPIIDNIIPVVATAGQLITITGSNFLGDSPADTLVSFDSAQGLAPAFTQGNKLQIALPSMLRAGTRLIRVQRNVTFPYSTMSRPGFSSSSAAFQLAPVIQGSSPFAATQGTTFAVRLTPNVGRTQQATLYIGDTAIPLDERPTTDPDSVDTLNFSIPANLAIGTYPVRVEIDGVQSALIPNASGQFTPQVKVSA
jgi:hypothetical protein